MVFIHSTTFSISHSVVFDSLQLHGLYPTRLLCPWNSPDKNTVVGNHSLLYPVFQTQGSNPGLLHCRRILYHLSHQGSRLTISYTMLEFSTAENVEAPKLCIVQGSPVLCFSLNQLGNSSILQKHVCLFVFLFSCAFSPLLYRYFCHAPWYSIIWAAFMVGG